MKKQAERKDKEGKKGRRKEGNNNSIVEKR
jgi:hypothetical protein